MQLGFAMLEVGSVRIFHVQNILIKVRFIPPPHPPWHAARSTLASLTPLRLRAPPAVSAGRSEQRVHKRWQPQRPRRTCVSCRWRRRVLAAAWPMRAATTPGMRCSGGVDEGLLGQKESPLVLHLCTSARTHARAQ